MEKRTSIYICTGCGIGDTIDTDALCNVAKSEFNIPTCHEHNFLCSKEGIDFINDDLSKNGTDSIIIGACSPRVHTSTFKFGKNILTERVNLREQVAWCSKPNDEDTQMMAEDYIRMGIVKSQNIRPPTPYIEENLSSDVLVTGGGISTITAAIEGSKAGYKILLVEKDQELGGWARNLFLQLPQSEPYQQLVEPVIFQKIEEIRKLSNIELLTSTSINEISGQPVKELDELSEVTESDKLKHYDSQGKIDPFKPLIQAEPDQPENIPEKRPARILTPLEKIDLSQIRLVAVIILNKKQIAMVEEASGKGYEVGLGTYIGKNQGRVTEIKNSSIVITELVRDFKGRLKENIQEIKLHKNDNGE